MRAADALCEALKAEGVEHVFGIPGGGHLRTYDALYDADLLHIQSRHEQGAGHAAEGYAKASGRVGVAFATSGPGATNLVTAIADAMMDSVPTVFITGQVRTELIGTDGFQEADVTGITLPIVKHSFLVQDPRQIPEYIHKAFHIASTGRPGPVLVDVPQDLSRVDIDYEPASGAPNLPGYKPPTEGNIKQIRVAARAPVDPAEISKNVAAHIPIVGDAGDVLPKLLHEYRAASPDPSRLDEWWDRIKGWQAEYPLRYEDSSDSEIKPQLMIEAMYEATGGD